MEEAGGRTEKGRRGLGGKNSAQERQKMFVCPTILQNKRGMALQITANQLLCPTKTHMQRHNWRAREKDTSYIDMVRYISSHPDIWRDNLTLNKKNNRCMSAV